MRVEVHPATPDRWSDVVAVFGRRGEDPSWCWCRLFLRDPSTAAPDHVPSSNRDALFEELRRAAVPPGLVAYVDDRPAGWTRVGPRSSFPALRGNRSLGRVLADEDAGSWWVTCFAVDRRYRNRGVGVALLRGAVALASAHGATAVEGHPVDVERLSAAKVGGAALYTGTKSMFTAAGFVEIGRTAPTRPVMRRAIRH